VRASNSAELLGAAALDLYDAYVSDLVLVELSRYFRRVHGRQVAWDQRAFVMAACKVIEQGAYEKHLSAAMKEARKEDAAHLAAAKALSIPHLVSSDSDFEGVKEWIRPADFLRLLGMKPNRSEV